MRPQPLEKPSSSAEFPASAPLIDPFGRRIDYMRVSVTDRCDLRCVYCMSEHMNFLPKADLLTLEELDRLCSALIGAGVRKHADHRRRAAGAAQCHEPVPRACRAISSRALRRADPDHQWHAARALRGATWRTAACSGSMSRSTRSTRKIPRASPAGATSPKVLAGHRGGAGGRAEGQDQLRGAEGRQRRRIRWPRPMGAWARHGRDPYRGHAARRGSRPTAPTSFLPLSIVRRAAWPSG